MWFSVTTLVFSAICVIHAQYYEVPEALIEPLKPKGLRISIPDEAGVELFAIHVNVNKPIYNREAGQINTETRKSKNGRWVIEDPRVRLKLGDTLNYWLYVQADGLGYPKDDLTFTVKEFVDAGQGPAPTPKPTESPCLPSVTTVNGATSCAGRLVFEDLFDSFNHATWQHTIQIADRPFYEFVVYGSEDKNSYVSNGRLHIKPTLLSDDGFDVLRDTLSLNGCTGSINLECYHQGQSFNILPPVRSAQLKTKKSFNFKYGRIEVQAKLPTGDWVFPEIWLEPKSNRYGGNPFESGQIRMAMVRGNQNLEKDNKDLGRRLLEVSATIAFGNEVHSETFTNHNSGFWTDAFHNYVVEWTQNSIVFSVDSKEIGRITPPSGGFSKLPSFSQLQNVPWEQGSTMAPFDQDFYLTIGVGVGGFSDFPDDCTSNNHPKPWKNNNRKAKISFWNDKDNWYPTWSGDASTLQVEHVKVWAL